MISRRSRSYRYRAAPLLRRTPLLLSVAICLLGACTTTLDETRQATGIRIGEVTETSAIIWTRITEKAGRRTDGVVRRKRADKNNPEQLNPNDLEGSVPGAEGRVRLLYGTALNLEGATEIGWQTRQRRERLHPSLPLDGASTPHGLLLLDRNIEFGRLRASPAHARPIRDSATSRSVRRHYVYRNYRAGVPATPTTKKALWPMTPWVN